MTRTALALLLAGLSAASLAPSAVQAQDIDRGKRLYLQCRACHTLEEGGAHKVGPNLWEIFGSEAGSRPGFENYSDVLMESGIVWDAATLDEWLQKPRDFLPGNRMAFAGVRSEADRASLIAYIKAETGFEDAAE